MKPATTSQRRFENTRMLVLPRQGREVHGYVAQISDWFQKEDLLVVNDSGTLPSSFRGHHRGQPFELRLGSYQGTNLYNLKYWSAVAFGAGDWRLPTEERGLPPVMEVDEILELGPGFHARIREVDPKHSRLLHIEFLEDNCIELIYRYGRPIQYSYLTDELRIWDQQTMFSGLPISVEPPSAGIPFNHRIWQSLVDKGVRIVPLLHSAGLSSTGDPELDRRLPFDEFFWVSSVAAHELQTAHERGQRITALGTTVVRALESLRQSEWSHGAGLARGRLASTDIQVAQRLITGLHEVGSSHMDLVAGFVDPSRWKAVNFSGYLNHEYGDLSLVG